MSLIPIERISSILSRAGFDIEKCDIEKISKLVGTDDFHEIIDVANELDFVKLPGHLVLSREEREQMTTTRNWMIDEIKNITTSESFMEVFVKNVLTECVNGHQMNFEDGILVAEDATPFNLSKWQTIDNFLEEFSPQFSYVGEMNIGSSDDQEIIDNLHPMTFKGLVHQNLNDTLFRLIDEIMIGTSKTVPKHVRSFIDHLFERDLAGLLFDEVHETFERGKTLTNDFDKLASRLPFRETLLKYFPNVKKRLDQDILIARLLEDENEDRDQRPMLH